MFFLLLFNFQYKGKKQYANKNMVKTLIFSSPPLTLKKIKLIVFLSKAKNYVVFLRQQ